MGCGSSFPHTSYNLSHIADTHRRTETVEDGLLQMHAINTYLSIGILRITIKGIGEVVFSSNGFFFHS